MSDQCGNLFRCDRCPITFITESGVRRHMLCVHARRYHRGRALSPVPPVCLLSALQSRGALQFALIRIDVVGVV